VCATIIALLVPCVALAASDVDEAITVAPAVNSIDVDPGETITFEIVVKNQTLRDVELAIEPSDLAKRSGGSASLSFADPGTQPRGAGGWLTAAPAIWSASAGTERTIPVTVQVPDDAGAGGHFAALIITATPTVSTGEIQVTPETSVVALFTVSGRFKRSLDVRVTPSERWRWRGGVVEWDIVIHNTGDVHENVSGTLDVNGALSSHVRRQLDPGILFPDERRVQHVRLDLRDSPDLVRASARIIRDDAPVVTAVSARSWVLPWWMLVLIAAAVGVIVWRVRSRATDGSGDERDVDIADW